MTDVIVIGDGPGGLSAALFLAKNGLQVAVFGKDKTAMHWAQLHNYLGVVDMHGSEFQKIARKQVSDHGGEIRDELIASVEKSGDGFSVKTEGGDTLSASQLILSEGNKPKLAPSLGIELDGDNGIVTDRNSQSSLAGVYIVGRAARPGRSQAIISAGDGAAAAIDILSRRAGKSVADWDSPPKEA
jgi:thioredoxin reductase